MKVHANYTILVEYNPPGYHPVTVTVFHGTRKNLVGADPQEFNGKSLTKLLKEAQAWIEGLKGL